MSPEEPWLIHVVSGSSGVWRTVTCSVTAEGLRAALTSAPPASSYRTAAPQPERSVLIVSDVAMLDEELASLNLLIRLDETSPDRLALDVIFNTEQDAATPLIASLQWGETERTTQLDAHGRGSFTDLPRDSLRSQPEAGCAQGILVEISPMVSPPT